MASPCTRACILYEILLSNTPLPLMSWSHIIHSFIVELFLPLKMTLVWLHLNIVKSTLKTQSSKFQGLSALLHSLFNETHIKRNFLVFFEKAQSISKSVIVFFFFFFCLKIYVSFKLVTWSWRILYEPLMYYTQTILKMLYKTL